MNTEELLKKLIIEKSGSVNRFAQEIGIAQSTLVSVFSRGVNKSNINTIIKICQALEISADALIDGRIVSNKDIGTDFLIQSEQDPKQQILIERFYTLSPENQKQVESYISFLLNKQSEDTSEADS